MVQNELAQMSVKTTKSVKTVRATSSPIEGKEKLTARRLLVCIILTQEAPLYHNFNTILGI